MLLSVAVVAAVRVAWKDEGNKRDPLYYRKSLLDSTFVHPQLTLPRTQRHIKRLVLL
jgi:hypothetical protein